LPVSKGIEMGRNEFDAHRHWGATGNCWAPVYAVKRGLTLATAVGAAGVLVAVVGALNASGWV